MLVMPRRHFSDHLKCNQLAVTRVTVPAKVAIDADHIHKLGLCVGPPFQTAIRAAEKQNKNKMGQSIQSQA